MENQTQASQGQGVIDELNKLPDTATQLYVASMAYKKVMDYSVTVSKDKEGLYLNCSIFHENIMHTIKKEIDKDKA